MTQPISLFRSHLLARGLLNGPDSLVAIQDPSVLEDQEGLELGIYGLVIFQHP